MRSYLLERTLPERPLIVTDRGVTQLGLSKAVEEELTKHGMQVVILSAWVLFLCLRSRVCLTRLRRTLELRMFVALRAPLLMASAMAVLVWEEVAHLMPPRLTDGPAGLFCADFQS